MPKKNTKLKTRKAITKRVRITKTGKIKAGRTGRRHLLTGESGGKKRRLRRPLILGKTVTKKMKAGMFF